jgi:glycosyltransferase involved in cell wall biosynthesis
MKYPYIIFYRNIKCNYIDDFFDINKDKLLCSVTITDNKNDLYKLFDSNYHLLVTFGENETEYYSDVYNIIANRMSNRWIHFKSIDNIDDFNNKVNHCYMSIIVKNPELTRPIFSLFTTCYNSFEKIYRPYNSIMAQSFKDWEWVILDDSPDDKHFDYLKNLFKDNKKIRLYKRSENNGSIGNVKNEVVSLCRGKYVLELDHDDDILPDILLDATNVFENDSDIGFIYMDFANVYENYDNFNYGNHFGLGYAGYYRQKYNNKWLYVAVTPNINNITLSHIVAVPNHPRIWRRKTLLEIGNYNEYLPISDDYELLVRTAANTKIAKIHKLAYIQYMNNNNNNFSLIRNSEINRLRYHLTPWCYNTYKIDEIMKKNNGFEEFVKNEPIWKKKDYEHKYYNKIINLNYKKQYCIIGLENIYKNYYDIKKLYQDKDNDFLLLDNKYSSNNDTLCKILDVLSFDKMKCYSMDDCSIEELVNYFHLIYKSCDDYYIIDDNYIFKSSEVLETSFLDLSLVEESFNKNKITIITPCIRPNNLYKIKESINFDYVNEWLIIYDKKKINENPNLFLNDDNKNKIKEYLYEGDGRSGNPQRNFALDNIKNTNTYLYFLDDDNIIHPDLYNLLDNIDNNKIYTFDQSRPDNVFPYKTLLPGNKIELYNIDSAMILIDYNICKNIRWDLFKYNADGIYIMECYSSNKNKWIYINKTLSYYNYIC